jgi:hypothetical protein
MVTMPSAKPTSRPCFLISVVELVSVIAMRCPVSKAKRAARTAAAEN